MTLRPAPPTASEMFGSEPSVTDDVPHNFQEVCEGRYSLELKGLGIVFEVDRLRRDRHELVGELSVRCALAGARTYAGVLSWSTFNLSSTRARQERARHLGERAKAPDIDWLGVVEELCQRVLAAERKGQPAILLRDLPRPGPDQTLEVDGLPLPMRHPMILFGDGGSAKSYLALYLAGRLELQHGARVGLFDWEMAADDHRERLGQLFGHDTLPETVYARCDRPLIHEADRLRRIVRDQGLDYVVLDSIAFACDGPPEAAEVAARYFQAVRQLGMIGSLSVAHVSKAENADRRPFGSAFWHNGARATWNVKLAEGEPESPHTTIGLYPRKWNLGRLPRAVGFDVTFDDHRTVFRRVDVADVADLSGHLPIRQRMAALLRRGAMSPQLLADEIDADLETVKRTARRYRQQFTVIPGGNLALLEHRR